MSYQLSDKTKELLSKRIGIPYEELIKMDDEEIEAYIEKKTGKKIEWPKGDKVDGLPIRTMEDVDKKIDKVTGGGLRKDVKYMLDRDWEPKVPDEETILKQSRTQLKRGKSTESVSLDMKAIKSLKDDEAR